MHNGELFGATTLWIRAISSERFNKPLLVSDLQDLFISKADFRQLPENVNEKKYLENNRERQSLDQKSFQKRRKDSYRNILPQITRERFHGGSPGVFNERMTEVEYEKRNIN